MSNIYNHRSLVPAAAAVQPAPPQASSARLADLLDFVKHEFDVIGSDASQLKGQRDDFEHRIAQQVNEVSMMQQHIIDLEKRHTTMAAQYEDEIKRLRQILDTRGGADGPSGSTTSGGPAPPHLPSSNSQGLPPPIASGSSASFQESNSNSNSNSSNNNNNNNRNGSSSSSYDRDGRPIPIPAASISGDRERERGERERLNSAQGNGSGLGNGNGNGNGENGSNKRMRLEGSSGTYAPGSPGGGPKKEERDRYASPHGAPPLPPSGAHSSRERERERERDTAGPSGTTSQAPSPGPAASGNASLANLSELDPDEVPKDLKKEGSDWLAIFNPKVKRVLDVNLVHTLMHESVVCCVRFSPDGKFLATGCNRSAQIYDTKTGAKTCVLTDQPANSKGDLYIRSVCFSPDGKLLATGAEDRLIRIWDIAKKKVKTVFQGHKQEIYSLDYSRDGRIIASGSGDKTVRIWDVETGQQLHTLYTSPGHQHSASEAGVTSVSISADSRLVAAGALDTLVRVWDTQTGQQLERLKSHKDSIYSVSFAPDGKSLVSGSLDKTLKMWDLTGTVQAQEDQGRSDEERTGNATCATTFLGHKDYVLSVSCSPDGDWVASGSKDRGVQFWDPRTAQTQFVLQGHKNSVIAINLSPAGGMLATGSGDFNARIWSYDRIAS